MRVMDNLDPSVLAILQAMLHNTNPFVRDIRAAAGRGAPNFDLRIAAGRQFRLGLAMENASSNLQI